MICNHFLDGKQVVVHEKINEQIKQQCKSSYKERLRSNAERFSSDKLIVIYISKSQRNVVNKRHYTFIEKKTIYIDNVKSVMYMNSKSLQSKK